MSRKRDVLAQLKRDELLDALDAFDLEVADRRVRDQLIDALARARRASLDDILADLSRDRLKELCRALALDDSGRAKADIIERLSGQPPAEPALTAPEPTPPAPTSPTPMPEAEPLLVHPKDEPSPPATSEPVRHLFAAESETRTRPQAGDITQVRHRQYLVEEVVAPAEDAGAGAATLVRLVCLDDDNQGRRLDVLWELELGARVLQPRTHGLGRVDRLDAPRRFGAYLNALRWNLVTATEARLFQAPFRAGIQLMSHQLPPLKRALELPRANLFIADDVGLGKTIEAGLVLQELQLRQRVDFVLIVCPAAICLQWRDEMAQRFGLQFELYNRAFVGRRRQQRGFQVNPWDTHNRFVISYQTLRRPEYREPLLRHLGDRTRKSLLILDEAHTAAPSTAGKYAVDSRVTKVIRDVAPRFENRLFLSATPHNGHSNSFSALLELLDPQRFTRGVPVRPEERDRVMVRRLKADLRQLGGKYPERKVVRIELRHDNDRWKARANAEDERIVGQGPAPELRLSLLLGQYAELMKPERGRGQLVFINLQHRLLSSVEAFRRTLGVHARSIGKDKGKGKGKGRFELRIPVTADDDEYGPDDETLEAASSAAAEASSRFVKTPEGRAHELLDEMMRLAEQHRLAPDAKVLALVDWIRRHQCPAVRIGGATEAGAGWSDTRVILFTEWGDTKRYLWQLLSTAVDATDRGDERIMQFHGGMSDDQRREVQSAFNAPPAEHPVRILIATDAAREGINLQAHCADLFHFDVPWNPARMEQRNGRIDRTLQTADEVRCHYFVYPQRAEDLVLRKLVLKVDTILHELGSLGTVIMERFAEVMDKGIGETTGDELDRAERLEGGKETTQQELEGVRGDLEALRRENDEAGRILSRSRRVLGFSPELLRDAVDVGLELAGADSLEALASTNGDPRAYALPDLPAAWNETLDFLRPPRKRDEPFWEWRRKPPLPVVFEPLVKVTDAQVHLHLQHPFIQRILSRFLAQGYSAQDLSRVTVIRDTTDDIVRAVAFGRLSLFGPGAARLHDELVPVMAPWYESGGDDNLQPLADVNDRQLFRELTQLLRKASQRGEVPAAARKRFEEKAPEVFAALWPHLSDEAESRAHEAERKLRERGSSEAAALRKILVAQRDKIESTLEKRSQLELLFGEREAAQREQFEQDQKYMERRLTAIDTEIEVEPQQIEELYQVAVRRLEPVGLVFFWPATRG